MSAMRTPSLPSVSHTHTSAAQSWSHKGTNGFTSKWDTGSK